MCAPLLVGALVTGTFATPTPRTIDAKLTSLEHKLETLAAAHNSTHTVKAQELVQCGDGRYLENAKTKEFETKVMSCTKVGQSWEQCCQDCGNSLILEGKLASGFTCREGGMFDRGIFLKGSLTFEPLDYTLCQPFCDTNDWTEECDCYCTGRGEKQPGDPGCDEGWSAPSQTEILGGLCINNCIPGTACAITEMCNPGLTCFKPLGDAMDLIKVGVFTAIIAEFGTIAAFGAAVEASGPEAVLERSMSSVAENGPPSIQNLLNNAPQLPVNNPVAPAANPAWAPRVGGAPARDLTAFVEAFHQEQMMLDALAPMAAPLGRTSKTVEKSGLTNIVAGGGAAAALSALLLSLFSGKCIPQDVIS
jgi:hypothetical protein